MQEDPGLIPGLGISPGEGIGYRLQYSCLGNPVDRGAWRATVHGVTESDMAEQLMHHWKVYVSERYGSDLFQLNSLGESKSESEVAQWCPTLCDPMDCSLPGSSLHGILQARVLEWVAISFSRGSSWPRDQTRVSRIPGRCFNLWATRELLHWVNTHPMYPGILLFMGIWVVSNRGS